MITQRACKSHQTARRSASQLHLWNNDVIRQINSIKIAICALPWRHERNPAVDSGATVDCEAKMGERVIRLRLIGASSNGEKLFYPLQRETCP